MRQCNQIDIQFLKYLSCNWNNNAYWKKERFNFVCTKGYGSDLCEVKYFFSKLAKISILFDTWLHRRTLTAKISKLIILRLTYIDSKHYIRAKLFTTPCISYLANSIPCHPRFIAQAMYRDIWIAFFIFKYQL